MWGSVLLKKIKWDNSLSKYRSYLIPKDTFLNDLDKKLKNHHGANWDKPNTKQLNSLILLFLNSQYLIKILVYGICILILHIFLLILMQNVIIVSNDKMWYYENQSRKGIEQQDTCAINKFISFIDKLKALDIYDKSMIIFKSDHGKPATYFSKEPNNITINGHKLWGYNRYRPTLMIKDFHTNREKPEFKNRFGVIK